MTACTVLGLSAQPPCYWNVSTLAGSGSASFANGFGLAASFSCPVGLISVDNTLLVADSLNNRIRAVTQSGLVSTFSGSGVGSYIDGSSATAAFSRPYFIAQNGTFSFLVADLLNNYIRAVSSTGTVSTVAGNGLGSFTDHVNPLAASFNTPSGIAVDSIGNIFVADSANNRIRLLTSAGVATFAGSSIPGSLNGVGTAATFNFPTDVIVDRSRNVYVCDMNNHRLRKITPTGTVTSFAGAGVAGWADGASTSARFNQPYRAALDSLENLFVGDEVNNRIRMVDPTGFVRTIAGTGAPAWADGFGLMAMFRDPTGVAINAVGALQVADCSNNRIRQLTCVPCPASYYCFSGAPVLCPAGSYCPLSSINSTFCPKGSFSNAGASSCTLCPAGTFTSTTGSLSCQQCPGGHYCPPGTSSWARLNCGRGNYCSDGSGALTPCPYQVPPSGGWGALQVQGPAFLVETARCLNHCFWNFTSGDRRLSKC